MSDITQVILDEHTWFRRQFAALDDLQAAQPLDIEAVRRVWEPLGTRLDLHASAEEQIFYPQLLRRGSENPEEETLDAIGDHNEIRDGVRDANAQPVGTAPWWEAVGRTRIANDDHMGEEEREGLSDFRRHAPIGLREALGRQFLEYYERHPSLAGVDISDKDPAGYVAAVEHEIDPARYSDGSLGIGSLKGR